MQTACKHFYDNLGNIVWKKLESTKEQCDVSHIVINTPCGHNSSFKVIMVENILLKFTNLLY